jgi:3-hydroxy-9,10-secoandrosta-1,3,5(10)-triene-9,17-dione monooxygenase reductase component
MPLETEQAKHDLRHIMGHYATGASIVTATLDGQPTGMAVNSLTSVSLEPPLILFCPDKKSETWPIIRDAGSFVVNILAHGQDHICRTFAKKGVDRFAEIGYRETPNGHPVLNDTLAYLECEIEAIHDAGDHYVTIGRVLGLGVGEAARPLVFYRGAFHELGGDDLVAAVPPAAASGGASGRAARAEAAEERRT